MRLFPSSLSSIKMRLYKFLSIKHAVENLVKRRIKISQYHEMNDPFELVGVSLFSVEHDELAKQLYRTLIEVIKEGAHYALVKRIVNHSYGVTTRRSIPGAVSF